MALEGEGLDAWREFFTIVNSVEEAIAPIDEWLCVAECVHGGVCSLPFRHEGEHDAKVRGKSTCVWPRMEGETEVHPITDVGRERLEAWDARAAEERA